MSVILIRQPLVASRPVGCPPVCVLSLSYGHALREHVPLLRDQMGAILRMWQVDEEITFKALLVLSELYTNVIRHVPPSPCTVVLRLADDLLRLTVRDTSTQIPPIPDDPDAFLSQHLEDESGRGIGMVVRLADEFRYEQMGGRYGYGKTAVADWRPVKRTTQLCA